MRGVRGECMGKGIEPLGSAACNVDDIYTSAKVTYFVQCYARPI